MIRLIVLFAFLFSMICSCTPLAGSPEALQASAVAGETVVLLHGFGRSNAAMWVLALRLKDAGYQVVQVGYGSLGNSPEDILQDVIRQIDDCCSELEQPVHFVGHSLGGLMIRAYLAGHRVKSMGKVVLIGTPNKGTPVVDLFKDSWWMQLAGPTASALGTDENSFPRSLPAPDYSLGIIAGVTDNGFFSGQIPGEDDGLVPVASTSLAGMEDFIIIETNHTMMRYNSEVALQTISFLRNSRFLKKEQP